jgi:glycosyltransferase involved in cell wall biosynthesis
MKLSVVMAVYNGRNELPATVHSVLSQLTNDQEFIVVDDGSTDGSGEWLEEHALNAPHLKVLRQENTGLTRALIAGCAAATGEYIARQDCGDVSLPGRFAEQLEYLDEHTNVVLTSCGTRFVSPLGEPLYDVVRAGKDLGKGLARLGIDQLEGPSHHGSTMFRRSRYRAVGGYRTPFVVAQILIFG